MRFGSSTFHESQIHLLSQKLTRSGGTRTVHEKNRDQNAKAEVHFFDQEVRRESIRSKRAGRLEEAVKEGARLIGINITNRRLLTLDAGCGTGGWAVRLAKAGLIVVAVDISAQSLKITKERSQVEKTDFSIIRSDVTKSPFKSELFDLCFCGQVLHHFPDLGHIMPELSRVVKKNGRIVLFEPNGSNIVFRASWLVKKIIPKEWWMKQGIATINETPHVAESYRDALESNGFVNSKVIFYVSADQAITYDREIIEGFLRDHGLGLGFIMLMYCLSFKIIWKLLPRYLGMGSLLITATKHSTLSR